MFSSPDFWPSLRDPLLLFCLIPLCLLLGLGLALIMDQGLRGTALFLHADSAAVRAVLRRDRHGLGVHVPSNGRRAEFLPLDSGRGCIRRDESWTPDVGVEQLHHHAVHHHCDGLAVLLGYVAVIFLAAIKNVPVNVVDAAKLDGAYMPRIYFKLIIPQLKGAMGSCITILAMYALRSVPLHSIAGGLHHLRRVDAADLDVQ